MRVRWAIVGCGVAGRARARALSGRTDAELVAVHRGRFAGELGAPQVDEDEILRVADVVAVCSPSATHEAWVERALEAGRHVVVEYPLARTAEAGRRLLALARAHDRLLHVEHIELLAPTTRWMAEQVKARGWRNSLMRFRSTGPSFADGPEHAWQNVSRLHRLVEVLGEPVGVEVHEAHGSRLDAVLRWPSGAGRLTAERGVATRGLHWVVEAGDGARLEVRDRGALLDGAPVSLPTTKLFAADVDIAMGRLTGERAAYVDDERLVAVLELAGRL